MAFNSKLKASHLWVFILIITCILFLESAIPYIYAEKKTPVDKTFMGQVAYIPDQNMYFSFISQARDGHFVFRNKLTAIPNKPVFFNLEFLLVGLIQRITGISENAVYQVWRFLGILLLTSGFVFLAKIVLPTTKRVILASLALLFSGGFGFLMTILNELHLLSPDALQAGMIDLRFGIMPFQQMTANPHFSFPHGLILLAYAFFLKGEKTGKVSDYVISGLIFNVIALVRPYDIIPPIVLFPLYLVISDGLGGFDFKIWLKKLTPLIMIVPVLAYDFWVFKINAVFKWWSLQGLNADNMPSVPLHYLAFGICGILAIVRMMQLKTNPLSKPERFLVLWFAVTFTVIHLGKYLPVIGWSPQIGVYLAVPLALLGFSAKFARREKSKVIYWGGVTAIALLVIISNLSIVGYFAKHFKTFNAMYYADKNEMDAWKWMHKNIPEGCLVLASQFRAHQMSKYTSVNVVASHYSVTPKYAENVAMLAKIFSAPVFDSSQLPMLEHLNVDYVYVGEQEKSFSGINADGVSYLKVVYANPKVSIYRFQPAQVH